jgi:hypothetical protein
MELKRLTEEEFARAAVRKLRTTSPTGKQFLGIHTVYSGFNAAWKAYFHTDPIEGINKLVVAGKICMNPTRGGVRIYLPEDKPRLTAPAVVLAKILGD